LSLRFFHFLRCFGYLGMVLHQHHRHSSSPGVVIAIIILTPPWARTVTSSTPLYILPCHSIVNPISLFLRYLPTETSHLSIAGPHYLCTLVSHIPHSISVRASIKVSKFCPRICKIATLVRAHRILTKEVYRKNSKLSKREEQSF
jgi:hypothetical protein